MVVTIQDCLENHMVEIVRLNDKSTNNFQYTEKHLPKCLFSFNKPHDNYQTKNKPMELTLSIEPTECIKCGKCVRVCPALIFFRDDNQQNIEVQHTASCIKCGHCVAVCPTRAVKHSEFPPEKIHPIDRESLPTPEQVMLLCKSRRSNRAFSNTPIPAEALDQILEAAHRAPTASNLQQIEFTLVTDPEKLKQVTAITVSIFSNIAKKLNNVLLKPLLKKIVPGVYQYLPTFQRLENELEKGNDPILRKATALILIHTPADNRFGCQDSNLAYQNGSLMAESLGISQFYTGFLCIALKQDKQDRIRKALGIKGKIHAGMALALPDFKYPNYIDKKEIEVSRLT